MARVQLGINRVHYAGKLCCRFTYAQGSMKYRVDLIQGQSSRLAGVRLRVSSLVPQGNKTKRVRKSFLDASGETPNADS